MTQVPAARSLMSTLDDDAWDDLLNFIEERRVIPIVGPELLMVSTDRGPRLLHDWVAEESLVGSFAAAGAASDTLALLVNKVIAEFSQRQIDYFHALPPALKGPETLRNGALALVRHAWALRVLGNPDVGLRDVTEAIQLLEHQRGGGDHSEATLIALALAYNSKGQILGNQNNPAGPATVRLAADLLGPLAESPNGRSAARIKPASAQRSAA
jgi:hypothetical protein